MADGGDVRTRLEVHGLDKSKNPISKCGLSVAEDLTAWEAVNERFLH